MAALAVQWDNVTGVGGITAFAEEIEALMVEWSQGETYPGHSGAILQWKGPGEDYDASRQQEFPFGSLSMFMHTIPSLMGGEEYTVRVLSTRRFAENGSPAEMTGMPLSPPPPI